MTKRIFLAEYIKIDLRSPEPRRQVSLYNKEDTFTTPFYM